MIAFKGVLLEGLEVRLIVVAFVAHDGWAGNVTGAVVALLVVLTTGLVVKAPLARVPENAIKFAVGVMVVSFGTFWTIEALACPSVWPGGDWSLPALGLFYAAGGAALTGILRRPIGWKVTQ